MGGAFSDAEAVRRIGLSLNAANTILRLLEAQGAQTRPV